MEAHRYLTDEPDEDDHGRKRKRKVADEAGDDELGRKRKVADEAGDDELGRKRK